jgi:DNA-binding beta-propeller fold protein YncE
MRHSITVLACVVGLSALAYTQSDTSLSLPNPYSHPIRQFAKHTDGRPWGSTVGLSFGPKGEFWLTDRCGANSCEGSNVPTVFQIDQATGNELKAFGEGLFVQPHGLFVDRDGNIWVTDAQGSKDGTKGHQVIKFSPDGKVLMRLGQAGKAGGGPDLLTEPASVTVAPNGDVFVGDGHLGQNPDATPATPSRIVKFSKDGKFIKDWGKWGAAPGEFKDPHALIIDSRGRLLVADRGNNRVQLFDLDGKHLATWSQFGRPSGLAIDKNDVLYVSHSENFLPGCSKGIRIGTANDGKVMFFVPPIPTEFPEGATGEGIAVDANLTLYLGENTTRGAVRGVTRYVRK